MKWSVRNAGGRKRNEGSGVETEEEKRAERLVYVLQFLDKAARRPGVKFQANKASSVCLKVSALYL